MLKLRRGRGGQAIILVTLSLFAMCGLLGLAIDLGYSYWVKKAAQTAADSAALAAAYQALAQVGEGADFTSTNSTVQSTPAPCDLGGNLHNGCLYASQGVSYGFTHSGNNGHQDITMESGVNSSPNDCNLPTPTAPCLPGEPPNYPKPTGFDYWVTVRTVETIPQLFSVLLGNTTGMASARATAAIMPVIVNGSLWTLNRSGDGQGPNIDLRGNATITANAGIIDANDLTGNNSIRTVGSTVINGPIQQMAAKGVSYSPPGACTAPTCNFQPLPPGPIFDDPMSGRGQPGLPGTAVPTYAVIGGDLGSSPIYRVGNDGVADVSTNYHGATLPCGNYFYAAWAPGCPTSCSVVKAVPGQQLGIGSATTFGDPSGFGSFFFYGGLTVSSTMTMGPGEYVIVGSSGGTDALDVGKTATIVNNGSAGPGELFIVTGTGSNFTFDNASNPTAVTGNAAGDLYPGLMTEINSNQLLVNIAAASGKGQPVLGFGQFDQQAGLGNNDTLDPTGLNPGAPGFPTNLVNPINTPLSKFAGVVFWQDQANSVVRYNPDGTIDSDSSCGGSANAPCFNTLLNSSSPEWHLQAQGNSGMTGIIYQPRGAWILIKGEGAPSSTTITGALQLITGQIVTDNGGADIVLTPPPIPLTKRIVALIE